MSLAYDWLSVLVTDTCHMHTLHLQYQIPVLENNKLEWRLMHIFAVGRNLMYISLIIL